MKLFAFTFLLSMCLAAGCNSNAGSSVNANVSTAGSNSADTSGNTAATGASADPAAANAPGASGLSADKARPISEGVPPSGDIPNGVIAPGNSIVTTSGGGDAPIVETRTFKDDPVVSKLEKSTMGGVQSAKVYLKSGKIVSVPASEIGLINSVPLDVIKRLAGAGAQTKGDAPASGATSTKPRN